MSNVFELHPQLEADSVKLMDLPLSTLLLANDSNYPWFILVPRRADISEIFQLDWEDQIQLLNESSVLSELIQQEFHGDKINVAALGNMVPQLHLHHVVRFKDDVAWPKPIWGAAEAKPYDAKALENIQNRVVAKLAAIIEDNSQ